MTDPTINIGNRSSLRARMLQTLIAASTNLKRVNVENYPKHRGRLEKLARLVPRLRRVKYERETLDGFDGEWMTPETANPDKVVYYLHGGGYALCSINTHKRLIATIAWKCRMKAFAINYRLAPEFPFPAAVDDAVKGYEHLMKKGFNPENILIAGDSAGGGLTIATLLKLREKNLPLPAAAACIAPWVDLEGTGQSITANAKTEKLLNGESILLWGKVYAGNESIRHPLVSPIHADLTGLPPLLIQVSAAEILLDDSVMLHKKALTCGVNSTLEIWNGLIHVWQIHTFLPETQKAIRHIADFAGKHL